jgi:hypothetical protein
MGRDVRGGVEVGSNRFIVRQVFHMANDFHVGAPEQL